MSLFFNSKTQPQEAILWQRQFKAPVHSNITSTSHIYKIDSSTSAHLQQFCIYNREVVVQPWKLKKIKKLAGYPDQTHFQYSLISHSLSRQAAFRKLFIMSKKHKFLGSFSETSHVALAQDIKLRRDAHSNIYNISAVRGHCNLHKDHDTQNTCFD